MKSLRQSAKLIKLYYYIMRKCLTKKREREICIWIIVTFSLLSHLKTLVCRKHA